MTLWSLAHQIPLSMGFSRQEYGSGWSCLPPGGPPNPGIKPSSLVSLALLFFTTSAIIQFSNFNFGCLPKNEKKKRLKKIYAPHIQYSEVYFSIESENHLSIH